MSDEPGAEPATATAGAETGSDGAPLRSMTGFGRAAFRVGGCSYRLELRSVNSRFLDVRIRLPWVDAELESSASASIRRDLARGRIELHLIDEGGSAAGVALRLDEPLAEQLATALRRLAELLDADLSTAAQLVAPPRDLVTVQAGGGLLPGQRTAFAHALQQAIDDLVAMREVEGRALARALAEQLDRLRACVATIAAQAAKEPSRSEQRLRERIEQLGVAVDEHRLLQEIAIVADRSDVAEELTRLDSHLDQLSTMLRRGSPIGRKLDFMMQELNRELNTVASKVASAAIAAEVVEAKSCVEKMREQVQNVE